MKKLNSKQIKTIGIVAGMVALVVSGMVAMVTYQGFINDTKQRGVTEYKTMHCEQFTYEDNSATWLECEQVKLDNGDR